MIRLRGMGIWIVLPLVLCARLDAGLIGTDQEKAIGRQVASQLERDYGLVQRETIVEMVRTVGAKVSVFAKKDRPKIDYEFNVLANKQINALACPGGYVYVFRGLVKRMPEEELLAAVLAHECAHVSQRHSMETIERSLGFSLLLRVLTGKESDLVNAALGVLMRGYSRDQEAEADRIGHIYLYKAGYDVGAMTRMLQRLDELTEDGGGMPNFLRTHPSGEARIEAAERREAEIMLDFGNLRPAPAPPQLSITYHPGSNEDDKTRELGEAVARELASRLTACAQVRATYFVTEACSTDVERFATLTRLASNQGVDRAVGLWFTTPPLVQEGARPDAKMRIRLSVTMATALAGADRHEFTYSYTTREEIRRADERKRIDETLKKRTEETVRALALQLLRSTLKQQPSDR